MLVFDVFKSSSLLEIYEIRNPKLWLRGVNAALLSEVVTHSLPAISCCVASLLLSVSDMRLQKCLAAAQNRKSGCSLS